MVGQITVKGRIVGHFDIEGHRQIASDLQQHQRISALTHRNHNATIAFMPQHQTMRLRKGIRQIEQRRYQSRCNGGVWLNRCIGCLLGRSLMRCHDCAPSVVEGTALAGTSAGCNAPPVWGRVKLPSAPIMMSFVRTSGATGGTVPI